MSRGVLERDPRAERVAEPEPGSAGGVLDGVDVVVQSPRGLAR